LSSDASDIIKSIFEDLLQKDNRKAKILSSSLFVDKLIYINQRVTYQHVQNILKGSVDFANSKLLHDKLAGINVFTKNFFQANADFSKNNYQNCAHYIEEMSSQIKDYEAQMQAIPSYITENIQKYLKTHDASELELDNPPSKESSKDNLKESSKDNLKESSKDNLKESSKDNNKGKDQKGKDVNKGRVEVVTSSNKKSDMISLEDEDEEEEKEINARKMFNKIAQMKPDSASKDRMEMEMEEEEEDSQQFDDEFGKKIIVSDNKGKKAETTKKRGKRAANDEPIEIEKKPVPKKAKPNNNNEDSDKSVEKIQDKTKKAGKVSQAAKAKQKDIFDFF